MRYSNVPIGYEGLGKLDVITISGYGGKSMAKRRCRGGVCKSRYGLLPHSTVTGGTTCARMKKVMSPFYGKKVERCADFEFKGEGGRGVWQAAYKKKKRSWPTMPTQGQSCKGWKTKGKGTRCKVRCASFSHRVGKSRASAAADCGRKAKKARRAKSRKSR